MKNFIETVIKCLTDTQRHRFLQHIDGISYTEIAKKEGVSVEAVRKSVKSAKKRIEKTFRGLKRG